MPWQHLSGVAKITNQLQSVQGDEKQRTHKNICKSKKQKSVAMATLVAMCCRKTNQLQSAQRYGKQRTHKNVYKSKKQKKVLPCQHLLPWGKVLSVIELISSNPCKNHEKVLPRQYLLPDIAKKVITHKFSCHETFTPILAETHVNNYL